MLYVFHVDAGQMTTYDMNLTLQSVASLKAAIERKTKIPSNLIVLLISGGEVLQSDHMVSSYSAGTDTNPIYMFCKPSVKESHLKQSISDLSPIDELSTGESRSDTRSFDGKSVIELKAAVERCRAMVASVHTVISCATLAQQFSDLSHEFSRSCDTLVHEQHLQHQGWAAVVANLEDIYNEFTERAKSFKESFKKHRLKKEDYYVQLNALNEVLESLGRIPILPALQLNAESHRFSAFDVFEETDFEGHSYRVSRPIDSSSENKPSQDFGVEAFKLEEEDVFNPKEASSSNEGVITQQDIVEPIEESDEGVVFKAHSYESKEEPTLLHWILAQGNKASLQDILDYCQKGLALIDAEPLKEREAELYNILKYANVHGLKQIKGIEDRLYGLDQMLSEVKTLERDQHDQAASLIQYRDRLNSACDPSVLPTLVQSHWCQLDKLLKGHQRLVDIRRRIAKSKDELSHILKARLEAVLMIENSMSVQDAHSMLSFQCFNRLSRYFEIVRQLQRAPAVFVRAVHEVARRRTFSHAHVKWAQDLAEKLHKIHEEEVGRRQEFNIIFEGHFLRSLFPGMTDLPPAFATQAPPSFDVKLPKLTNEDVQFISKCFPELAKELPEYDMESTVQFFHQRLDSHRDRKDMDIQVDDKDIESVSSDFEKLGRHSGSQKQTVDTSTICLPDTNTISIVTEDNMDTHRINMDRLNQFLSKLCCLCRTSIVFIREELVKLKTEVKDHKTILHNMSLEILKAWERNNDENALKLREEIQRLTVDHELELSDMKETLNAKDEDIANLIFSIETMKQEHINELGDRETEHKITKDLLEKAREEVKIIELKLEDLEIMKKKEMKELQDKLHSEYKAEIESMRTRFRLVALTNMDRSPSESSLEKIERSDVIEIGRLNSIVMQTQENAEVEKEEAIKAALEKGELEWQKTLSQKIDTVKTKYEAEKQVTSDMTRRLLAEKDRQLDLLREREQNLARECTKYRETIQQLTDPETNDYDSLLKTHIATLENEKAVLHQQLQDLKKEMDKKIDEGDRSKEEDSENRSDEQRPDRRSKTKSHTPIGLGAGTLSLSSCLPGHTVLVMWDKAHLNYTVMQESSFMYFVHSGCLPALDLSIQVKNENERKLYAIATVESKEYCYAKKSGNRYHMPRGSRFYRVRVKPLRPAPPPPACCDTRHRQDMQKSVDTSQSTSSNTDEGNRVEVATATLINLESPVYASDQQASTAMLAAGEDQLDSIEASEWSTARMHMSASVATDMECSVGRCELTSEPIELTASTVSDPRGSAPPADETAEEAAP